MSNQNRNLVRPGGELATRPLYFFWVADNSTSMQKEKIGALNNAIQSVIPEMKSVALENPNAQVYIRTLRFSSGASWITPEPVPIEEFVWDDLEAAGLTDMGKAFTLLSAQLSIPPMPERALPPVIVLISDGMPTDDYKGPLEKLLNMPWGKKAVRIAISIGKDANENVLAEFTGNPELVFKANNATMLTSLIKWASTLVGTVSSPASKTAAAEENQDTESAGQDKDNKQPKVQAQNYLDINSIPKPGEIKAEDVW